jgi:hypothetical protein
LHQTILTLYTQWLYQGRDITNFLSNPKMKRITDSLYEQPEFTQNLNLILEHDRELLTNIRQAIHFREETPNLSILDED